MAVKPTIELVEKWQQFFGELVFNSATGNLVNIWAATAKANADVIGKGVVHIPREDHELLWGLAVHKDA